MVVNGEAQAREVEPRRLLGDFLRDDLGIQSCHFGCEHGVCGACTVLLDGDSVRACLVLAVQADGAEIETLEGLATGETLHPLQEEFWRHHALQCSFCTSGMVMTALDLIRKGEAGTPEQIREGLSGNVCRCTGYENIVRAVRAAAERVRSSEEGSTR